MKKLQTITLAILLPAMSFFVSGCYTPSESVDTNPRFHEGAYASVVLEFYRWDNFFIKRPEFRDSGFLRPLRREELGNAFTALNIPRDMAVVVVGWNYDRQQTVQIIESWKTILRGHGFHRIVCLRANEQDNIDGLRIIDDWKQSVDEPKQTARL